MTDCEFIICHLICHSETGNLNIARIHRLIVCFNFISSKQFLSGAFVFVIFLFFVLFREDSPHNGRVQDCIEFHCEPIYNGIKCNPFKTVALGFPIIRRLMKMPLV